MNKRTIFYTKELHISVISKVFQGTGVHVYYKCAKWNSFFQSYMSKYIVCYLYVFDKITQYTYVLVHL